MPRGITNRTREKQAKATEKGILKARIEDKAKTFKNKKHFMVWLQKIIEEHASEIPKGIAIMGLAFIIKSLIDTSEELRSKVNIVIKSPVAFGSFIGQLLGRPKQAWEEEFLPEGETFEGFFPDWADWVISFSLAYVVVEHGGQIALGLGEAVKGLSGIIGFMLG